MDNILQVILLGVIEGITEFLPISSTGHLLIAQHWLGPRSELFTIAIQSGAILAVTLVYREELWRRLSGWRQPEHFDYLLKVACAFGLTAALGLLVRALGWELPETVAPIAAALIFGGIAILLIERHVAGLTPREQVTWVVVVAVGLAQVLAGVFPGTSRSAAAIFAAMLAGLTLRPAATQFAFIVGIPTMFAATGYAALEQALDPAAAPEPLGDLALAFIVSALTGFVTVRWLLGYITGHSFAPFAWYRIVFGAGLLLMLSQP